MNKVLFSVLFFLLGIGLSQAQVADDETKIVKVVLETAEGVESTTNIVREDWKSKDDIEMLNDKYDINEVALDQVFIIRNDKMEKADTPKEETAIVAQQKQEIAKVESPKEKDLSLNNSKSRTSTKAGSAKVVSKKVNSSSVKSKKKKSGKIFKKRLKNRKFRKYTGKSCFRF